MNRANKKKKSSLFVSGKGEDKKQKTEEEWQELNMHFDETSMPPGYKPVQKRISAVCTEAKAKKELSNPDWELTLLENGFLIICLLLKMDPPSLPMATPLAPMFVWGDHSPDLTFLTDSIQQMKSNQSNKGFGYWCFHHAGDGSGHYGMVEVDAEKGHAVIRHSLSHEDNDDFSYSAVVGLYYESVLGSIFKKTIVAVTTLDSLRPINKKARVCAAAALNEMHKVAFGDYISYLCKEHNNQVLCYVGKPQRTEVFQWMLKNIVHLEEKDVLTVPDGDQEERAWKELRNFDKWEVWSN